MTKFTKVVADTLLNSIGDSSTLQVTVCNYVTGNEQVAQLSQRDRAAGWVSNGQKW